MVHLPNEILVLIFSHLKLSHSPSGFSQYDPDYIEDHESQAKDQRMKMKTLHSLSVACWNFHHICNPLVYDTVDLRFDPVRKAHFLLKGLMLSPERKYLIRAILIPKLPDMDNSWVPTEAMASDVHCFGALTRSLKPPKPIKDRMLNIFRVGTKRRKRIDNRLYGARIVLILLMCPNIETVILPLWSDLRESLIMRTLSDRTIDESSYYCQLRELRFCECKEIVDSDKFHSGYVEPTSGTFPNYAMIDAESVYEMLQLPGLRSLHLWHIVAGEGEGPLNYEPYNTISNLKHLYLRQAKLKAQALEHMLVVSPNLQTLSLQISSERDWDSLDAYGDAIREYGTSLETLIIEKQTANRIGTLKSLTSLRKLVLPMSAFEPNKYGDPCEGMFSDVLPTSLEYLKISTKRLECTEEGSKVELKSLLADRDYTKLHYIHWVYINEIPGDLEQLGWDSSESWGQYMVLRRSSTID